jgi:predicted DNA-binding transcriptional regulator YafY
MRTLQRQWLILSRLPRAPRKVDAAWLEIELNQSGVNIHRRTIQRDLITLSQLFPLVCHERSKPYGWSWAADATIPPIGAMTPHGALLIVLAASVFEPLLPRSTVRFARTHLAFAERVLASTPQLAKWPSRVEIGRRDVTPLLPDPAVLEVLYTAVETGRSLEVTTITGARTRGRRATIEPVRLAHEGDKILLVGRRNPSNTTVQIDISKIVRAKAHRA